jgi:iron complex outermembrane receptor protein
MSWTNQRNAGLTGMCGMLVLGGAALGQEARQTPIPTTDLSEIVVTAEKRAEKIQDVPIAMTVVSSAQLTTEHVYNIADLARTTPALEMVQAFGGPGGGGQIRGIGTNSFSPTAEGAVGIVVDGVPQGDVNITNIFDVQQVEVLKGPQGTLFGLTASAGVINMISAAPDPSKFEAKAQLDYSDLGRVGSEFGEETVRAVLNAPITGNSAVRLAISDDRTKGVQVNELTHDDSVSTDWSARLRYRIEPTDELQINLIADYDRRGQNYNDPQFNYVSANAALAAELASCGITASYSNNARCGSNANDLNYRNYGASAQVDYNIGSATLTSITGYRKQITAPNDFDPQGLAAEFEQIVSIGQSSAGRQFTQELRIASHGQQTVDYVGGLFYSSYSAETAYRLGGGFFVGTFDLPPTPFMPPPFPFTPFVTTVTSTDTTNKSEAAFGQATYHVTEQLGLIGGLRYTHQTLTDFTSANLVPPALTPAMFGALTKDNVSGKLGLQYKINPDLTSYFTVTRGYKGPQVTPAAEGTSQSVVGAEIPTAFELGIKGSALEHQLGWDADVFYSRVHDYQGQSCSINPVGALVCIGQSVSQVTTKGVELNAFGKIFPGLTVNAGYIYDEAEYPNGYTGYDPNNLVGGTTDMSHLQLVGVPKNKVSLSGEYSFALAERAQGFFEADTVYKSAMRLGPTADPRFVFPQNWNTGLRLGARSPGDTWSVALFARNIGKDREPVTLFGGPSFTPPGANPLIPLGAINGVSGWTTANSLRQVGITINAKY